MHYVLFGLVCMSAFCAISVAQSAPTEDGYTLIWQDEFDTDGLPDPANWTYEEGFVRNQELQWYTPENTRCEDGHLVIEARRVDRPNPKHEPGSDDWRRSRERIEYTSSCLQTRGKHAWRYGRFEVRAKVPVEAGMWPAIWMLGTGEAGNDRWPRCGEIDLMEYYQNKVYANACWSAGEGWRSSWDAESRNVEELTGEKLEDWADRFHVWRMDWDEQEIRLYLDEQLINTVDLTETINRSPDGLNPFHHPHYLLLNLAVGANGGDPSETELPKAYLVDYVRVYQKKTDTETH